MTRRGGSWLQIPDAFKALVEQCWAPEYDARPEFDDVVERVELILKGVAPTITSGLPPAKQACCSLQ